MIDTKSTGIRISEMAIRGQLSKRVKPSLSIDNIVENIKTEREYLIKEKATKISKVSTMLDDETFEVPSGWKWVALGDLCILLSRGKSPKYSEVKKYPVFAQKCNQPNCLALDKALFLDETTLDKWPEYFRLREADVVINSTGTGTVGRVGYYTTETLDSNYEFMLPDSHVTVVRTGKNVSSRYIYYALRTATIQNIMEKTFRGSTNQKEFYIDSVYSIPIPLPPVEEQEEIVKILDSAFEQLSIIDDLQTKYSNDLAVLKSKIIDAGIQGKLTEQLPEDGNAEDLYAQIKKEKDNILVLRGGRKDKSIKTEDEEKPFEIPDNWKWIRFGEVGLFKKGPFGSALTKSMFIPKSKEAIKVYEQQHAIKKDATLGTYYISREYFDSNMSGFEVKSGDIIVSCAGTIGEAFIMPDEIEQGIINQALMRVTLAPSIDKEFFLFYFDSNLKTNAQNESNGMAIKNIPPFDVMKNWYFPLPPYAEQKRIVKKIESVMEQLD